MASQPLPYKIYLSIEDADGNTVTKEFTEPGSSPMQSGASTLHNSILMSDFIKAINMLPHNPSNLGAVRAQARQGITCNSNNRSGTSSAF